MAKRSRPITAAEARLIEAAIKERSFQGKDKWDGFGWGKAWDKYSHAVAAVVKERKGRE